jgi:hypothetical protein
MCTEYYFEFFEISFECSISPTPQISCNYDVSKNLIKAPFNCTS